MTESTRDPMKWPIWRLVQEGFVQGRADVPHEVCHPRYRNDTSIRPVPDGPEGLSAHIRNAHANIEGIDLHIVDILAEGDRAAIIWATQGIAGRYVGVGGRTTDTSAWLIGHFGFVDGLILDHSINWEPLRLMTQGGATIGADGADVTSMELANLRYAAFSDFMDVDRACAPRHSPRDDSDVKLVENALSYSWGTSQFAPPLSGNAYLSFADLPDQHGESGLAARRDMARRAFANPEIRIDNCVCDGGRVIMRFTLSLQHVGTWLGMHGGGRHLQATGSVYARIEGGKIVTWVELVDVLRLVRQIGGFAVALPGCFPDQ